MTGTGNDIVSLNAINKVRTKQSRFYSKILSPSEETLYSKSAFASIPFENFVWLLWSIKESAFKYLQRTNPDLIFSPTKIIVHRLQTPSAYSVSSFDATELEGIGFDSRDAKFCVSTIKGIIAYGPNTFYSRSIIYKELVVSVVNGDANFESTSWGIKWTDKCHPPFQSIAVRKFLVNRLYSLFQMDNLMIGKSSYGFPIVLEGSEEISIPISLSHHDHFVAYSFQSRDVFCSAA